MLPNPSEPTTPYPIEPNASAQVTYTESIITLLSEWSVTISKDETICAFFSDSDDDDQTLFQDNKSHCISIAY